jgi:membrane associated rhomboid family serine protease
VFVPLQDENPLRVIGFQYVTVALIAINVVVFFLQSGYNDPYMTASFALVPSELFQVGFFGGQAPVNNDLYAIAERNTALSYMFLHGDFFHLLGNMLFLWVFGDNVEDAMGHVKFLLFYLACGLFAGLFHAWMLPSSDLGLIGASGAVAGVIAAYLMLHPRVGVWVLAFKVLPLRITAALALGLWIAMQFFMVFMQDKSEVAWWAHIGGLIAGAVLVLFLRRPGVPLFDQGLRTAGR